MVIWAGVLVAAGSGFSQHSLPQTRSELVVFLNQLGDRYEKISVEMGIANWNVYSGEGEADQDKPKKKYARLLLNPVNLTVINEWLERISARESPRLYRRLKVWKNVITAAQVDMNEDVFSLENQLEAAISGYCHQFQDRKIKHRNLRKTLETILGNEITVEKNYHELMAIMQNKLEPKVIQLMKLRNRKSKAVGFTDYGHLCLKMMGLLPDDISGSWFYDFLHLIERKTRRPYKKLLNSGRIKMSQNDIDIPDLEKVIQSNINELPEHVGYEKDRALDLAKQTLLHIGFNLEQLPIRIVEKIIPYGGLGLAIRVPSDHRILVFPERNSVSLYLHELGHGLHAVFITWNEPIFKNYEWCLGASSPAYDEGMANVMSGFCKNWKWQIEYNKKDKSRINQETTNSMVLAPYTTRHTITRFMFEIRMYQDLSKSPQQVKKSLAEKWLLIKPSQPVDPYWATSIFPVAYPCYLQNYFISRIIAWQVHKYLKKKFGEDYIFNQKVGGWLQDNLYQMGHGLSWHKRLKRAVGKSLDVLGYLASLGIN
jgi:hypothetical protein